MKLFENCMLYLLYGRQKNHTHTHTTDVKQRFVSLPLSCIFLRSCKRLYFSTSLSDFNSDAKLGATPRCPLNTKQSQVNLFTFLSEGFQQWNYILLLLSELYYCSSILHFKNKTLILLWGSGPASKHFWSTGLRSSGWAKVSASKQDERGQERLGGQEWGCAKVVPLELWTKPGRHLNMPPPTAVPDLTGQVQQVCRKKNARFAPKSTCEQLVTSHPRSPFIPIPNQRSALCWSDVGVQELVWLIPSSDSRGQHSSAVGDSWSPHSISERFCLTCWYFVGLWCFF